MNKAIIFLHLFLFVLPACKKEASCPSLSLLTSNISDPKEYAILEKITCNYTKDCAEFIHISQKSLSSKNLSLFLAERKHQYENIPFEEYITFNDSSFIWDNMTGFESKLINSAEISCYFSENIEKGWTNYYHKFPTSKGYLSVGRPLIIRNKAYVEYAHFCNLTCGYGFFTVLEEENGNWQIKEEILLWVS
jgi:hypothetical protein